MAIYKVRQGAYNEIYENKDLILPDGFELITGGDNDIGHGKYNGLFHWLGCTTKEYFDSHEDEFKGFNLWIERFGPLIFIKIHNTQFYEKYPYVISDKEFNEKWQFSKYRIAEFSEDFRLKNMLQIQWIESEFRVKGLEVTNRDYFDNDEFKKLEQHDDLDLTRILSERKSTIHVNDNEIILDYWYKMISDVISPFGASIPHKNVNLNAAHDAFSSVADNPEEDHLYNLIMNHEKWVEACDRSKKLMNFEIVEFI